MSDRLERPRGGPPPTAETRQLAIAGVHRRAAPADVPVILAALGLTEPGRPDPPDTVFCGCGRQIKAQGRELCVACRRKAVVRRTAGATGGDA